MAGAQVLSQTLCLGVRAGGGGDARSQQPDDNKVDRPEIGQLVAAHFQLRRFRQKLPEARHVKI